jgi:hypothetical protein
VIRTSILSTVSTALSTLRFNPSLAAPRSNSANVFAMTPPGAAAARRLVSNSTNVKSCYHCILNTGSTPSRMHSAWSICSTPIPSYLKHIKRPVKSVIRVATPSTQRRRYTQPATAPSPDDFHFDQSISRRTPSPDATQFPFPSKKNPSPYEILHLSTTADPKEIKQRCTFLLSFFDTGSNTSDASPQLTARLDDSSEFS